MKSLQRLCGRSIFLSASVPARDSGYENERLDLNVDEAVISLARTVFAEGGQLVFGGHPSISPLVLMIATEYTAARKIEDPLAVIYQSEIFEHKIPNATLLLLQMGYGRSVWTPAAEGEEIKYDPVTKRWGAPDSLAIMRRAMINETKPAAFIAVGGMEGVEEELKFFSDLSPYTPAFTFATTGGAAERLALNANVVAIDRVIQNRIAQTLGEGAVIDFRPAALYPAVAAEIVRVLSTMEAR